MKLLEQDKKKRETESFLASTSSDVQSGITASNAVEEAGSVIDLHELIPNTNKAGSKGAEVEQTTDVTEGVEKQEGADAAQEEDNAAKDKVGAKTNLRVAIIFLALLAAATMVILARRKFNRS